jgi:hypothetical protein
MRSGLLRIFPIACLRRLFGLMMSWLWASYFPLCIYQVDELKKATTAPMRSRYLNATFEA